MTSHRIKRDNLIKILNATPKGVMLPDGQTPSGITNATNPGSLANLLKAKEQLDHALSTIVPAMPEPPRIQHLPIEQKYVIMGERIGICPHELKEILNSEIDEDQELVLTLMKKFIAAAKLSGSVDLSALGKRKQEVDARNRSALISHEQQCEYVEKHIKKINGKIREAESNFAKHWGDILIELVTKVQRNPNINSLGSQDKWMILAIADLDEGRFCVVEDDIVKLDFKSCKVIPPNQVVKLHHRATQLRVRYEENLWRQQVAQAPLELLIRGLKILCSQNEPDKDKRNYLEWAIVTKSGRRPIYDRDGNLDIWETMNNDWQDDLMEVDHPLEIYDLKGVRFRPGKAL